MVSIIIPYRNDSDTIYGVLNNLVLNYNTGDDIEIIVVNDGSKAPNNTFMPLHFDMKPVRVVNNSIARGVGYSIDRGVEVAQGDVIVIMGADVYPEKDWYKKVVEAVSSNPNNIGCAVSVGLTPDDHDMNNIEKKTKRYGANLLVTISVDDLPANSKIRQDRPDYTAIFEGQWAKEKKSDSPYPISCLMGAFYFTSKAHYQHIHGWDTEITNKYVGHRNWGSLEPYISLKSYLAGGGCVLYPNILAGHIFGRIGHRQRFEKGVRSLSDHWWNRLFILETMVLEYKPREMIYCFIKPELNYNMARSTMTKDNYGVKLVRERNRAMFTRDFSTFCKEFNVVIK